MFNSLDIITIGESLIEFSSDTSFMFSETFNKYYGGNAVICAISALRSGSKVGYITKVGNDGFGEFLLDAWQSEGLDTSQVKLSREQNGVYFVASHNGKLEFQYYRKKTAASTLSIDDINFDYIKNTRMVYATSFIQALSISTAEVVREVFKFAKQNDIVVAYDVNWQKTNLKEAEAKEAFDMISDYIDIVFIDTKSSSIFETNSPTNLIAKLSDLAIKNIVVKDISGTHVLDNGDIKQIPNINSQNIKDTTGSDSGFNGAYLSAILQGHCPTKAVQWAKALSSMQCQNVGAVRSIPNKKQVEEYYRQLYE